MAELEFCGGSELKLLAEAASGARKAARDRRRRGRRRRRQHSHRGRRACRHKRSSRHPSARHAQSFRQGPRHPAPSRGGRGGHRQGRYSAPSTLPRSMARPSSTTPRSASILIWCSTASGGGRTTSSPNGWRWCRPCSACCGIFRAAGSRSRPKAGRGPTARPACLSATTNTAWSFFALGRRHHLDRGKLSVYVVKQRARVRLLLDGVADGFRQGQPSARRRKLPAEGFSRCAPRQAACRWRSTVKSSSCTLPCTIARGLGRSASSCPDPGK